VWLSLRERFLAFCLSQGEEAIVNAPCAAWNTLRGETGQLTTLTSHLWIVHAINQGSR
jgi:hypothetical protein